MGRTVRFSFMTLVYAFLYLPIIVLIANSFNENKFGMKWGGFTTKWYHALVNNDSLMQAAWHSFNVAIFSATAAKDLGASEWVILKQIILPLAKPAVAAGWLLSFTLSLDDVIISSFVTGPTYEILPLKIYSMVKVGISPEVNALATVMLVVSLVLVITSQILAREKVK
ncbi:ABC transporter permease subunit [Vibrio vulnificus]|uniref:ABC transporter permease subunit n=1 Tax=Vibrio vulnificus TaxID=672 RepID=UPI00102B7CC1|nr:ABC transporter permease subunit [Vibrio vulnificus]RZQ94250.1 ABC transporter permease subunit [Vibrio vulnificus]